MYRSITAAFRLYSISPEAFESFCAHSSHITICFCRTRQWHKSFDAVKSTLHVVVYCLFISLYLSLLYCFFISLWQRTQGIDQILKYSKSQSDKYLWDEQEQIQSMETPPLNPEDLNDPLPLSLLYTQTIPQQLLILSISLYTFANYNIYIYNMLE